MILVFEKIILVSRNLEYFLKSRKLEFCDDEILLCLELNLKRLQTLKLPLMYGKGGFYDKLKEARVVKVMNEIPHYFLPIVPFKDLVMHQSPKLNPTYGSLDSLSTLGSPLITCNSANTLSPFEEFSLVQSGSLTKKSTFYYDQAPPRSPVVKSENMQKYSIAMGTSLEEDFSLDKSSLSKGTSIKQKNFLNSAKNYKGSASLSSFEDFSLNRSASFQSTTDSIVSTNQNVDPYSSTLKATPYTKSELSFDRIVPSPMKNAPTSQITSNFPTISETIGASKLGTLKKQKIIGESPKKLSQKQKKLLSRQTPQPVVPQSWSTLQYSPKTKYIILTRWPSKASCNSFLDIQREQKKSFAEIQREEEQMKNINEKKVGKSFSEIQQEEENLKKIVEFYKSNKIILTDKEIETIRLGLS